MKKMKNISHKPNLHKGFSLIEILQTVVLAGIIAGLSVSFLRKVNTDEKITISTVKLVAHAIEEANIQMCTDNTLYCNLTPAANNNGIQDFFPTNPTNMCTIGYPDPNCVYDATLGMCRLDNPAGGNCPGFNGGINTYESPLGTPVVSPAPAMTRHIAPDGTVYCTAPVPCLQGVNNDYHGPAEPLSNTTCRNDIPQWDVKIPRQGLELNNDNNYPNEVDADGNNLYPVSEICYRLWDIINHKQQTLILDTDAAGNDIMVNQSDLYMTCVESQPCINTQDCGNEDKANMILPNGARLYNLSCVANKGCLANTDPANNRRRDYQHIFIKADRIANDTTFAFPTNADNIGEVAIINAVQWFENNLYDATNAAAPWRTACGSPAVSCDNTYGSAFYNDTADNAGNTKTGTKFNPASYNNCIDSKTNKMISNCTPTINIDEDEYANKIKGCW